MIDFRYLKPSQHRRIKEAIGDSSFAQSLLFRLGEYLSSSSFSDAVDFDNLSSLSHEIAATGIWDVVDAETACIAFQSVPRDIQRLFLPRAMMELQIEDESLNAIAGERADGPFVKVSIDSL